MEKICTKCKRKFPATRKYFYSEKRVKSGLRANCKLCSISEEKKHRMTFRVERNRRRRERYRNDPIQRLKKSQYKTRVYWENKIARNEQRQKEWFNAK